MKILEAPARGGRRIAIYGDPKSRKTNLATSLPWGPDWGNRAVYVADDPGSERLESVLGANREHLVVVVPDGPDPYREAVEIASKQWEGVGTIIWDTFTERMRRCLHAFADSGVFSENKHISVGKKGETSYMAQPMMGDYAVTQRAQFHILNFLFRQPLNVVVLFHADLADQDTSPVYGPKTVGKSSIRDIGGLFDNLFRMEAKEGSGGLGGKPAEATSYWVHCQKEGRWLAGARATKAMGKFRLGDDPVEFWKWLEHETKGEQK